MKRVAVFADVGTESTECIATVDVLTRAGIEVCLIGQAINITVYKYYEFKSAEFDAIVFPGGGKGVQNFKYQLGLGGQYGPSYTGFAQEVFKMKEQNKLIAAICAAPSILGEMGFLKGKKYTCYPGFESDSFGGKCTREPVQVDGNVITARSMYYSVDFGLAIVEILLGKAKREAIEAQVKGLK